jgi:rubrerythrin
MASMENLKKAFAGESQANRRYLAFAQKAKRDGFKHVAKRAQIVNTTIDRNEPRCNKI